MSQDTPTVDPLRFALSPWAFTGDEIALVRKRLEEAMRAALSATQPAQAAQGEPVQGVPDGWEIREDDTWIYFKRPDGFCQAVTPNDPHTSHAQTLHMLMRAMLTSSPTPPAQPAVAQGAGFDSDAPLYTQPAAGADVVPEHVALLNEKVQELEARDAFEAQNKCSHGFKRSARGTYVNPPVARDWKWFQLGIQHANKDVS